MVNEAILVVSSIMAAMSTVQEKRLARERRVFDTAARLFATRGYHATRMQDIADELAMQKGSLYYYFDSKESLLLEIVERRVGVALAAMQAIMETDALPTAKLKEAVAAHLNVFQEHADLYTIFNFERLNLIHPQAAETVDELAHAYEMLWRRLLQEGIAAGEFRADLDAPVLVKAIVGMFNSTLLWFDPAGRLTVGETAVIFAQFILQGLVQNPA